LSPRDCPIVSVISVQAWKHWVAGTLALICGLVFLAASYTHLQWSGDLGPAIPRLLRISTSPALAWFHSLVLFVCAQLACVILWARCRSLKDFGGRYRIWGWAAATWLLLSFSVSTQAHEIWSATLLHYFPWRAPGAAMWCWLVPASIWGWALALRLEQDMREDRSGYWVLLFACFCQLGCVSVYCQREFWPQSLNLGLNQLFFAAIQLVGHLTLLLSMSLHTRYVLFFSAEPPPGRRRSGVHRSLETVPVTNSLFQRLLPNWMTGVKMPRTESEDGTEDDTGKRGRKRASPKKKSTARKTTRRSKGSGPETDEATDGESETGEDSVEEQVSEPSASKKTFRVDKP